MEWQPIETAPRDGTPLLLFARCKTATAPVILVGWHIPDAGRDAVNACPDTFPGDPVYVKNQAPHTHLA